MNDAAQKLKHSPNAKRPLVTFALGAFLLSAGYFVWPGCAIVPLPSKRTPIASISKSQVRNLKSRDLTRDAVEHELGKPDEYIESVSVACYRINELNRSRVMLFLCVLPVFVYADRPGTEVAFVQYDSNGKVARVAIRKLFPASRSFRGDVNDWLGVSREGVQPR